MHKNAKIYIAGIRGMVGSSIARALDRFGFHGYFGHSRVELDLTIQNEVNRMFAKERPEYVFLAAAKVGGIQANSKYPADFIYSNLSIQTNVINAAAYYGVKKLLFLGSSCIYPRLANQPITEDQLLTGPLEPTNEAYAIAKIAGIKMCEAYGKKFEGSSFVSCMPTNLYGPGDNYHPENSHVLPALIRRAHESKSQSELVVWGSGSPLREFLYVDDLADACVRLMYSFPPSNIVNVGSGVEVSIKELVHLVCKVVGFEGNIVFDSSKPDGTPRKLLDSYIMKAMGWEPKVSLEAGIKLAYDDFLSRNIS